jgi:hypothetical protein
MYWYAGRGTRRFDGDREIPGVYFPAFIHNEEYYFTNVVAYQDGMVECWGLVTFAEFVQKVHAGWVVTSLPEGATVCIHHLARFTATEITVEGTETEFIKDVANAIEELNGRPTAQARLVEAIQGLRTGITPERTEMFRSAYAALPAYCRKYTFGSRMEKYKDFQQLLENDEP